MSQLRDDLASAKRLIGAPAHWTKRVFHKEKDGTQCYCAAGALRFVAWGKMSVDHATASKFARYVQARAFMEGMLGEPLTAFNDADETTHSDIMALFDRAIEAAAE